MKKNTQKKAAYMWDLMIPLLLMICILPLLVHLAAVSYTHLDVYKRQGRYRTFSSGKKAA